jgi:hypothetical protein
MLEMIGPKSDAPARLWMRKTTQAAAGNAPQGCIRAPRGRRAAEHPRGARRIVAGQMTQIELLQHSGFRRVGSPRNGFRFVGAPPREVPRLRSLRIPPAWTDVAVSRNPRARLLAIGRDKKGRWQYVYSQAAVREREQRKYEKLIAFGRALPRLRRAIDRGMRLRGLPHDRVMACICAGAPARAGLPGRSRCTEAPLAVGRERRGKRTAGPLREAALESPERMATVNVRPGPENRCR